MSNEHRAYGWQTAEMNHSHAYLLPAVMRRLGDIKCRTARLVDLGCGNGWYLRALARRFPGLRGVGCRRVAHVRRQRSLVSE